MEKFKILFPEKKSDMEDLFIKLASRLRHILGDNLVSIESFAGPNGENVKIIVREKTWNVIDKVMEEVWRLEVEENIEGEILPNMEESV